MAGPLGEDFARIIALARAKLTDVRVELDADPKGFGKPSGSLLIHLARAADGSIIAGDHKLQRSRSDGKLLCPHTSCVSSTVGKVKIV